MCISAHYVDQEESGRQESGIDGRFGESDITEMNQMKRDKLKMANQTIRFYLDFYK